MCLRMGWRMATRRLALPQGRASSTDIRYSGGRAAARAGRKPVTPVSTPVTTQIQTTRSAEPRPHKEETKV